MTLKTTTDMIDEITDTMHYLDKMLDNVNTDLDDSSREFLSDLDRQNAATAEKLLLTAYNNAVATYNALTAYNAFVRSRA